MHPATTVLAETRHFCHAVYLLLTITFIWKLEISIARSRQRCSSSQLSRIGIESAII